MKVFKKSLSISKRVFSMLVTIAVFIFLPFVVFTLITSKTTLFPSLKSYVVVSGSMEPSIPTGSIIYTIAENFYSKGDIIAFNTSEKVVSHRVLGVETLGNEIYYSTKGDANDARDQNLVARSEVVGKTFLFVPYLGKLVMAFKTPIGFAIGIVLPALLFVVMELWNIKKEIEKVTERKVIERLRVSV